MSCVWQRAKERKVQRRVDTDEVPAVAGVSPDELRDAFFTIEHFSIGEEVLLSDAQGIFPHGVAEGLGKLSLDKLQRIDAEAVGVVARNGILIGEDQGVPDREDLAIAGIGDELLERFEVAAPFSTLASRTVARGA